MRIRFDDFEIDEEALELSRAGRPIPLSPMATRMLIVFARRQGQLVPREALYEGLWPEGFVDRERLVNTYVRQIRAALGERAGDDRFLRTYPRRGYRFLPEVQLLDSTSPVPTATGLPRKRWPLRVGSLVAAAALGALLLTQVLRVPRDLEGPATGSVAFQMGKELLDQPAPQARASSVAHFRVAVDEAPASAPAHAGLAEGLFWAGDIAGARRAATRALDLDPANARAHLVVGTTTLATDWAWPEAEAHLRAAVKSAPSDPDPGVALAYLLVSAGRNGEALQLLDRTTRLDPASAVITGDLGMLYGWLGHHERALELCRRTIAIEPDATWGHECALDAAHALGRTDDVRERASDLIRLRGGDPSNVLLWPPDPSRDAVAVRLHQLAASSQVSHFGQAVALASLGRADEAVAALTAAAHAKEPGAVSLASHPALRSLSGHPQYDRLRAQVFSRTAPLLGSQ